MRPLPLLLMVTVFAACSGGVKPCTTGLAANPAGCPSSWAEARPLCQTACASHGLTCQYEGAGDCSAQCCATAVAGCADGGWACGQ